MDGTEPITQCERFIEKVGYEGLFSIEFIRDASGNDYFMEINFRNDGNSICVTKAGCNLPYIWYNYSEKGMRDEIDALIPKEITSVYVMPEYDEINLWYSGKISFKRMMREFRLANVFMEFDKEDPKPTNGRLNLIVRFSIALIKRPIKQCLSLLKIMKN